MRKALWFVTAYKTSKAFTKPEPDRTHKKPVSKHGPVGNALLWMFVVTIGYLAANQQMISSAVICTDSRETFVAASFKPYGLNSLYDNPCPSDPAV